MSIQKAEIVLGSIWGDCGKGITTDFLCRKHPVSTIVVRFSGGQQAGHNVVIGKYSHIHANYGSGTLRGVPSYFSEHCTIYPVTMYREQMELNSKNIVPELYIHPLVNVTTPADVAYNRMTEKQNRHGSCGIGIASTMKRNVESGYKLFGIDLLNRPILEEKIKNIYRYYINLINDSDQMTDFHMTEFKEEFDNEERFFWDYMNQLNFNVKSYDFLTKYNHIIFEGSQGILLDMTHGTFPHVTYANTTSKNALEICKKLNIDNIEIFYVTRCYQTRHGKGWMSNSDEIKLINNKHETNVFNEWQRDFKVREIDYELLNHSYAIDNIYSEGIRKNLVVTCLDQRPDFKFEYEKLNGKFDKIYNSSSPEAKCMKIIHGEEIIKTHN